MTIHESEFYKDKLAQVIVDVQDWLYTCTGDCGWSGHINQTTLDQTDGTMQCPVCGILAVEYVDILLSPSAKREVLKENISYITSSEGC